MAWSPQSLWMKTQAFLQPVLNPEAYCVNHLLPNLSELTSQTLLQDAQAASRQTHEWQRHRVHTGSLGEQQTLFKGQGLDFAELREYMPGDDIRKLDWQVFARTQVPHIRDYREERQMTVWLAVDFSLALSLGPASGKAGQLPLSDKWRRAIQLCLFLSQLALDAKAKVGLYWQCGHRHGVLKPSGHPAQLLRMAEMMMGIQSGEIVEKVDTVDTPWKALQRLVLKQDRVMVLGDASRITPAWTAMLGEISAKSYVNVFALYDRRELNLPQELQGVCIQNGDCIQRVLETVDTDFYDIALQLSLPLLKGIAPVVLADTETPLPVLLHQWAQEMERNALSPSATKKIPASSASVKTASLWKSVPPGSFSK